jgi:hypothetical protein
MLIIKVFNLSSDYYAIHNLTNRQTDRKDRLAILQK